MSAPDLFDLTGKVVLVTGGNSGIGLGFAEGCAKAGADVVVWGRRSDANDVAAEQLRTLGARKVRTDCIDVADEAQVVAGMAAAVEELGRLDCLFANAGISHVAPSFTEMEASDYRALVEVNQHGAFLTLREACRHMKARADAGDPGGSLVVCGSLSIFGGTPGLQHYAAAKGALAAMTKGIAVEMGPHQVRANMIAFGWFDTGMMAGVDPAYEQAVAERTPLRRIGQLNDIHGIAAFLASDASKFLTGDVICLDGGRMATSR